MLAPLLVANSLVTEENEVITSSNMMRNIESIEAKLAKPQKKLSNKILTTIL